jgi:hypothetical protein
VLVEKNLGPMDLRRYRAANEVIFENVRMLKRQVKALIRRTSIASANGLTTAKRFTSVTFDNKLT